MGIVAIVDILVTASSIQVQVELHEPHVWQYTDIWCAAYPHPTGPEHDPWTEMNNVHVHATTNPLHNMPPIHFDVTGAPINAEQTYWVRCKADEISYGEAYPYFLQTIVTTHEEDGCHTGVHLLTPPMNDDHLHVEGPIQDGAVDLGHTKYYDFPAGIRGLNVFDVPRPLAAGSDLELTCCRGHECEFWVTMYVCPECTGPREDGLRANLLATGWDSGSCSPKFDEGRKTISFHKHVNANSATWTQTLHSNYDEIAVVFGLEGCVTAPWCKKGLGPAVPEIGAGSCWRNGACPEPFGKKPNLKP